MLFPIFPQRQCCLLSSGSVAGEGKSRKWDEWRYQQAPYSDRGGGAKPSVGLPGQRQSWGGGGFEGFCFISFSSQTFYQRSIQATPSMKITNLLKHFHQNMSIFTGHSLKKSREKPKLNLFFPSSSCPVNWKKSIICSYSATGVRNPTEHLWSWHFSLTSSSVQDPQFQWHLPVSALTRNT